MTIPAGISIDFQGSWKFLAQEIYTTAAEHGFHGNDLVDNIPTKLMLIVSEVAEAMEAHRKPEPSEKCPSYSLFTEELADAVIRIMDLGHMQGCDIAGAILAKMKYNKTRPYMHGGKAY